MEKWFIENNNLNKNKQVVNILPFLKVWYSKYYFLETGVLTPAFKAPTVTAPLPET